MSSTEVPVDSVRLPDLETIRRFSIAVRSEHADVDEVIEALKHDLQTLLEATGRLKKSAPASEDEPKPKKRAAPSKAKPTGRRASGGSTSRR